MKKNKLIGFFYIIVVPVIILAGALTYWILSLPLMMGLILILAFAYIGFLSDNVDYGPRFIRRVVIPQAPEKVEELLKTTTYSGDLIYVQLISAFGNDKKLSQTELVNRVKKQYETQLTHQSIRNYIVQLENNGLIHSPQTPREREYSLTDKGQWCFRAIRVCFPKSFFWVMVRHYLEIRKLDQFPHSEKTEVL